MLVGLQEMVQVNKVKPDINLYPTMLCEQNIYLKHHFLEKIIKEYSQFILLLDFVKHMQREPTDISACSTYLYLQATFILFHHTL